MWWCACSFSSGFYELPSVDKPSPLSLGDVSRLLSLSRKHATRPAHANGPNAAANAFECSAVGYWPVLAYGGSSGADYNCRIWLALFARRMRAHALANMLLYTVLITIFTAS